MAHFLRRFTKRFFIITNLIVVALFLLSCANAFLHPGKWWWIAVLGLAFPYLLVLTTFFLLFWIFFRSKWGFVSLAALLLGYSNIRALMGFRIAGKDFQQQKAPGSLRILTWNVSWFDEQRKDGNDQRSRRKQMMRFIAAQKADVLCFQEYLESNNHSRNPFNTRKELKAMGYTYYYSVPDYILRHGAFYVGVAIFSRYPITDSLRFQYGGSREKRAAESLIAADVLVNDDTIRVFTTHLQSVLLKKEDYRNLEIIKNAEDSIIEASRSILQKLRTGYSFRGNQADLVREQLDASPHPEVICGDFNDVPNSYTYFRILGNRKDVFVEKGSGLDRTYARLSSTLRIDYMMADKKLRILQYQRLITPYSDHYAVVTDFALQ